MYKVSSFIIEELTISCKKNLKIAEVLIFSLTIFTHSYLILASPTFPVYSIQYLNSNTLWPPSRSPFHCRSYPIFKLNHCLDVLSRVSYPAWALLSTIKVPSSHAKPASLTLSLASLYLFAKIKQENISIPKDSE